MKKTLSLLSLATLITTFSGVAHAENLFVTNQSGRGSMQVTVTEKDVVKDLICIQPMSLAYLTNYESGHDYDIKAELKNGYGCDGATTQELSTGFRMPNTDMDAQVTDYSIQLRQRM